MNLSTIGNLSLAAALLFSFLGLLLSVWAWYARDGRFIRVAGRFGGLALLSMGAAFAALEWALFSNDFSVSYVAQHHSIHDPAWVTFATLWAALSGSILLWATLQAAYTYLASRRLSDYWMAPPAMGTLFTIQLFFIGVVLFTSNPFGYVLNPPMDGPGPNPLLQNNWMMAVHPVLMYLGFVGLSVPFAYAVAAMVSRRYQTWVKDARWWTLVAWGFLTAALFAGGFWSYEVLGWGGYWAWDPVENASLIPWLLATAFIHTAMVQQRRGIFRAWNFSFIVLAFAAVVFGTFLTRSGVIESVHAFAGGSVGPVFLGFLIVVLIAGFGLLKRVADEVRDAGSVAAVSREGALLGGSVLFASIAFVVLAGTLFPLVVEAFSGARVSVGAPFFDQVVAPLGMILLLGMGVGPVLPWRHGWAEIRSNLTWMLSGLAAGFVFGLMVGWTLGVSLTVGLFIYNLVAIVLMVSQGVRVRAHSTHEGWLTALFRQAMLARRRYGSHIVHFGVALAALAIAFSQAYRFDSQKTLEVGQSWRVAGTTVKLIGPVRTVNQGNRVAVQAPLLLDGVGRMTPQLNYYPVMSSPLPSPDIVYTLGKDYYTVLEAYDRKNGSWATLRLIVTPMVLWLWISGGVIVLGTIFLMLPVPKTREAEQDAGASG